MDAHAAHCGCCCTAHVSEGCLKHCSSKSRLFYVRNCSAFTGSIALSVPIEMVAYRTERPSIFSCGYPSAGNVKSVHVWPGLRDFKTSCFHFWWVSFLKHSLTGFWLGVQIEFLTVPGWPWTGGRHLVLPSYEEQWSQHWGRWHQKTSQLRKTLVILSILLRI